MFKMLGNHMYLQYRRDCDASSCADLPQDQNCIVSMAMLMLHSVHIKVQSPLQEILQHELEITNASPLVPPPWPHEGMHADAQESL